MLAPPKSKRSAIAQVKTDISSDEDEVFSLRPPSQAQSSIESSLARSRSAVKATKESDSESEEEEIPLTTRSLKHKALPVARPGLSQLPQDEKAPITAERDARPCFACTEEQAEIGPLILDSEACIKVPASINRFLRDYQREGIKFMFKAWQEKRGAILGDDMGLGKTVQVIGFLSAIMGKTGREQDLDRRIKASRASRFAAGTRANDIWPTCLVLCPQTVTGNWLKELETWGYFEVAHYGTGQSDPLQAFKRGRLDVVVASHEYAIMRIDELKDLDFSCIFMDEAHKFKSASTKGTQAMNRFRCPVRIAMSGTVIQNRYEEMWSIFDWTNPRKFGTIKAWTDLIAMPLKLGQRRGASAEEVADHRLISKLFTKNFLPPFLLRRTKALIADQMPAKTDKIIFCPLALQQLQGYRMFCELPEVRLMLRMNESCPCGREDNEGRRFRRKNCCNKGAARDILRYMNILTCLANHAALFFPDPEDLRSPKESVRERFEKQRGYVESLWPESWESKLCNASNGLQPNLCGKWLVLRDLLGTWQKQGDKVLLFSRSIRLLNWLQWFVEHSAWTFLRLDGTTPQAQRQQKVDDFNSDPSMFLFLISTRAGGTGLNLTGANKVVIFDPSWNPAEDMQAMDRAYRFGQQRDVYVYRLIGAGTLEEIIYGRQIYKSQAANIAYSASSERRFFSGVEGVYEGELFGLQNILSFRESGTITKAIIEDCEVDEAVQEVRKFLRDLGSPAAGAHGDDSDEEPNTREDTRSDAGESDADARPSGSISRKKRRESSPAKGKEKAVEDQILASHGISYTHDHQQVMQGPSRGPRRQRQLSEAEDSASTPGSKKPLKQGGSVWPPPRSRRRDEWI
ncbi:hypothetical protein BCV69DRAFT_281288 [Microstroma glucosiphilum]|uniref:Uncharacterized protein n=1 Tax=Pseudomicrostroma glucosiphilum TaxID=1684307 RepID=A0A316UBR0_9BASI|nr:hypothetical protein BCV69DRAFT_281288 [Pseudomicrostroma glucosiphilum]PWN22284.1 hypothetical protein BCV69DRAFT_281288 [Pseudomicrostroma glucosiphilum]